MKKILTLLLLIVSTNVFAEWTKVITFSTVAIYVDYQSIIKIGNKVEMSFLQDYKSAYTVGNIKMLSVKSSGEYLCEENKSRLLNYYWYSENMGLGKLVFSKTNIKNEPTPVAPMTADAIIFNKVCSKK